MGVRGGRDGIQRRLSRDGHRGGDIMSDDTYLGVIFICSCCEKRKSECSCPCDGMGCENRIARPVDRQMRAAVQP